MRSLASRLASGEQFVPSEVELGPVPPNSLSQMCVRLTLSERQKPVRRRARAHGTGSSRPRGRKHGETASSECAVRRWRQQHGWCQGTFS